MLGECPPMRKKLFLNMGDFYHICRLCLKDSHRYCNIFECCLMEVINQVYELDICLNDGLPDFICVECLSKVNEFLKFKKEAHKGRSALLRLKQTIEALEDIQPRECGNFSKGIKFILSNPEGLYDHIRGSTTVIKEESQQVDDDAEDGFNSVIGFDHETPVNTICKEEEDPLAESPPSIKKESLESQGSETGSTTFEDVPSNVGGTSFDLRFTGSPIKDEALGVDNEPEDTTDTEPGIDHDTAINAVWIEEVKYQPQEGDVPAISPEQGTYAGNQRNREHIRDHEERLQLLGKRNFDCMTCHKSFNTLYSLKSHQRTHVKDAPFKCALCEKSFITKGFLRCHLIRHMRKEKCYPCQTCGKNFKLKGNLNVHLRTHTGVQPFQCDVCLKRFTQKSQLNSHLRIHSGDRPFRCHVCSKSFKLKAHLNTHVTTHGGTKPFECHVCHAKFALKFDLRVHLTAHDKRFECSLCGERFSNETILKLHLKAHGGGKTHECPLCLQWFVDAAGLENHFKTHVGGGRGFECAICGERFDWKGSLTKHVTHHHKNQSFECHLCGKRYIQKGSLNNHLRLHAENVQRRWERQTGTPTVQDVEATVLGAKVEGVPTA